MAMTVRDILMDADAFRRAYPSWPHPESEKGLPMASTNPTPQGISALLRKAGHRKAVVKIRGGRSGYCVHTDLSTGNVKVQYYSQTTDLRGYNTELNLAAYAMAIEKAGYAVLKPSPRWLIVTAKTEEGA